MWKDSIFCSHCPRPPLHILRFCVFFGKKNSLAFLEFVDNTNRIGAGNAALFELNTLSSQNGSEVVPKRYGATEETSLSPCDAAGISSRQFIPHPSPLPHLTALPKEPLGLCRLVVVSKCSGCRSLGKNGVIEIAAAKVRGWEDGGERGRHLDC